MSLKSDGYKILETCCSKVRFKEAGCGKAAKRVGFNMISGLLRHQSLQTNGGTLEIGLDGTAVEWTESCL